MRWLHLLTASTIVIGLAVSLGTLSRGRTVSVPLPAADPSERRSEVVSFLKSELAAARAENAAFHAELEVLRHAAAETREAAAEREPPVPAAPADGDPEDGSRREALAAGEHYRRLAQELEERLAAEPHDARATDWAREQIESQTQAEAGLSGTWLESIECSTQLCRTEFSFDDEFARARAMGLLPVILPVDGKTVAFVDERDDLRVRVFSERETRPESDYW
jgi:pyruvate/2-oxoglutarate dehydrogenase complex dihydrolipoamide acyltransferase (E2) component